MVQGGPKKGGRFISRHWCIEQNIYLHPRVHTFKTNRSGKGRNMNQSIILYSVLYPIPNNTETWYFGLVIKIF